MSVYVTIDIYSGNDMIFDTLRNIILPQRNMELTRGLKIDDSIFFCLGRKIMVFVYNIRDLLSEANRSNFTLLKQVIHQNEYIILLSLFLTR